MVYNLCVRESYNQDGEDRVSWNRIGILIDNNGKKSIKLFHIPNVYIGVFESKKDDSRDSQPRQQN